MAPKLNTGIERIVALALVALAALLVLPMFAGGTMWGWGMGMMGSYDGGNVPSWMAWVGPVMGLVWLVVILGGAYLVYRAVTNGGNRNRDDAMAELRVAYARGDLTDEEFEQRRAVLDRNAGR